MAHIKIDIEMDDHSLATLVGWLLGDDDEDDEDEDDEELRQLKLDATKRLYREAAYDLEHRHHVEPHPSGGYVVTHPDAS